MLISEEWVCFKWVIEENKKLSLERRQITFKKKNLLTKRKKNNNKIQL